MRIRISQFIKMFTQKTTFSKGHARKKWTRREKEHVNTFSQTPNKGPFLVLTSGFDWRLSKGRLRQLCRLSNVGRFSVFAPTRTKRYAHRDVGSQMFILYDHIIYFFNFQITAVSEMRHNWQISLWSVRRQWPNITQFYFNLQYWSIRMSMFNSI